MSMASVDMSMGMPSVDVDLSMPSVGLPSVGIPSLGMSVEVPSVDVSLPSLGMPSRLPCRSPCTWRRAPCASRVARLPLVAHAVAAQHEDAVSPEGLGCI